MLLRRRFVDGLSLDELGRLHRVHRATAARWLGRAQRKLSKETHAPLVLRLRMNSSELRSIFHHIRAL